MKKNEFVYIIFTRNELEIKLSKYFLKPLIMDEIKLETRENLIDMLYALDQFKELIKRNI